MSCSLCGPFVPAHYTRVAFGLLLRVLVPCNAEVESPTTLSFIPTLHFHQPTPFFFPTDRTLQAKKDVTGASNPNLADPEKSKKGEGIKDSGKIVVSCFTSVFKSGDGFRSSQAALLSNMSIIFRDIR
jgi:hypothetical protein